MIEHATFRIDGCLGGIQIFRQVVAERAAAERHDLSRLVRNRERDAPAEAIEQARSRLVAGNHSRLNQQFFRVLRFQLPQQHITAARRIPNPESRNRFRVQPAVFQVRARRPALRRRFQLTREKLLRLAVNFNQRRALLILLALFGRPLLRPWNGNAALFRDHLHRFRERALLHLHHETENVSTLAAAEAMKNLFHRMHREGRRLFSMKRAQSGEILPALLQAHVFADHANNVRLLFHPIRK